MIVLYLNLILFLIGLIDLSVLSIGVIRSNFLWPLTTLATVFCTSAAEAQLPAIFMHFRLKLSHSVEYKSEYIILYCQFLIS